MVDRAPTSRPGTATAGDRDRRGAGPSYPLPPPSSNPGPYPPPPVVRWRSDFENVVVTSAFERRGWKRWQPGSGHDWHVYWAGVFSASLIFRPGAPGGTGGGGGRGADSGAAASLAAAAARDARDALRTDAVADSDVDPDADPSTSGACSGGRDALHQWARRRDARGRLGDRQIVCHFPNHREL